MTSTNVDGAPSGARFSLGRMAGIVGPLVFVAVFLVNGALRPGYNPFSDFVSALSLGDTGWIQITNFVVWGLLFLLFTIHANRALPPSKAARRLLRILAVCYLVSGPFVMDPMGTLPADMTVHGLLHNIFGATVFMLSPILIVVVRGLFKRDPQQQGFVAFSTVAAVVCAAALVALTVVSKVPAAMEAGRPWLGLIQRSELVPSLLWLSVLAWRLRG